VATDEIAYLKSDMKYTLLAACGQTFIVRIALN
jgi:hypothetical protein